MLHRYSMDRNATIDTVAAACGLSRTTVSTVLRGDAERYRISPATARRVRDTASMLGWKPNIIARALNRKRTGTVGVLFPDVFERFMGQTVRGIEETLAGTDSRLMLSTSRFDREEELKAVEAFVRRGADGLILAPTAPFSPERPDAAWFDEQERRATQLARTIGPLPCVILDRIVDGMENVARGWDLALQDDEGGARAAVAAMSAAPELPRPARVGLVSFDLAASSIRRRREGYRAAAAELGFAPLELLLRSRDQGSGDLEDALRAAVTGPDAPTAWLATTDGLGLRTAAILESLGLRVGRDVQVARFGTDPEGLRTPLFGIEQPHRELGRTAARLLTERIAAAEKDEFPPQRRVALPLPLVAAPSPQSTAVYGFLPSRGISAGTPRVTQEGDLS